MGTLRLMPKTLALMAVQRQTAASTPASPWMRLAHTPSLRASLGQAGAGLGPSRVERGFTEGCFGVFGGDGGHPQGR